MCSVSRWTNLIDRPLFRKRPANGTSGAPSAKKVKTEESKDDAKAKEELKKQMKKLYYYR